MNPRERVIAALKRTEPDRVPLDLGATESSGMTGIAYNRLRRHLGLPQGRTRIFDTMQQIAMIEDDIAAVVQPDAVMLTPEPAAWKPWQLSDGSACEIPQKWNPQRAANGDLVVRDGSGHTTWRMPAGGFYFEPAWFPLAAATSAADLDSAAATIENCDWPDYADEGLPAMVARARQLDQSGRAVVLNLQCHLLAAGQGLRGYENFMVDLATDRAFAAALLERLTDAYIRRCDRVLGELGQYVQVVLFNDDLGTQNGPMLSPQLYRELILPCQKRLFGFAKSKAPVYILFHSCGAVSEFIPSLIEAGVDALNPVQVSAAGMDSKRLKREFGRDITFWGGGCNTQQVLNRGMPADVKAEVRRRIADFAPGGGFVFTQVHNIQPDVPPQNIMAMYEALREYGGY